jgi:hypothetical protein
MNILLCLTISNGKNILFDNEKKNYPGKFQGPRRNPTEAGKECFAAFTYHSAVLPTDRRGPGNNCCEFSLFSVLIFYEHHDLSFITAYMLDKETGKILFSLFTLIIVMLFYVYIF